MSFKFKHSLRFGVACSVFFTANATYAQSTPTEGGEGLSENIIVVTAQKREQVLQDVPIAVTAFQGEFLQETATDTLIQLESFTPNLSIAPGLGNSQASVFIRGIGSPGNSAGIEPSVGVFIDDVFQARLFGISTDLIDIERVEVLRGPQGTLYGRNTSAGAINIVTNAPDYDDFSVIADGRYGSFNEIRLRGSVSAPLVPGKVAVRLSGSLAKGDGQFTNTTLNDDEARNLDQWSVRGKIGFRPSDQVEIELRGFYQKQDESFNAFDFSTVGPATVGLHAAFGLLNELPSDPFDYDIQQNRVSRDVNEVWGVSLKATIDLGAASLVSVSAYQKYDGFNDTDADFTAIPILTAGEFRDLESFSQEIRLVSNGDNDLDYVFGVFGAHQIVGNEGFLFVDGATGSLVFTGFTSTALAGAQASGQVNETRATSLAAFGQVTYRIAPNLDLIGGLRLNYEDQEHDRFQPGLLAGYFLDGPPLGVDGTLPTQSRDETRLTGTLTAQYFVNSGPVVYATFSRGYKPGGFNSRVLSASRLPFLTFEPETSTNYEIGAKFSWPRVRGFLNVAAFHTKFDDLQVETNNQIGGTTFLTTANAATAKNTGFEFEGGISPLVGLDLAMTLGYTFSEYGSYPTAPCTVGQTAPDCVNGSQNLSGRQFGRPPLNASLSAQYEQPIGSLLATMRADYLISDAYNASDDLDPNAKIGSVDLLNLRVAVGSPVQGWELSGFVRNVTDEKYFGAIFDAPVQAGSYVGVPAQGRRWGVEARVSF